MPITKKCIARSRILENAEKRVRKDKKRVETRCLKRGKPRQEEDGSMTQQCASQTKSGKRCKRYSVPGQTMCYQHIVTNVNCAMYHRAVGIARANPTITKTQMADMLGVSASVVTIADKYQRLIGKKCV
uniref:Uncharacterized protein n=1 Tax=viral metagenome TaxID=1070528 RepID=A0A6C0M1Y3_9ZZZZ